MHKLMIIGSNSFSGASFIDYALKQGAEVIGTSRSKEPVDALLPYKWQSPPHFTFHQLDLNNHLKDIIDLINHYQPDYVINYAAQSMVAESWQYPGDWFMTNAVSTIKLHDALRQCHFLKRYVHISTPEVYGHCSGFVKENYPFNPSTPYAVSRAAADMSLRTFHAAYQFPVVTTRAANVYGPGQQLYRIIPKTILSILLGQKIQLHGGGVSTRSFIHIDDVSAATWQIMQFGQTGNTYHISTPHMITIRDLVEKICHKLNATFADCVDVVGERLGKDAAYQLDTQKIRSELKWQEQISLEQGLDDCIRWATRHLDVLKLQPLQYIHRA